MGPFSRSPLPSVRVTTPWRYPLLLHRFWSVCHPNVPATLGASENHLGQSLDYMLDAGVWICASAMRKRSLLSETTFLYVGSSNRPQTVNLAKRNITSKNTTIIVNLICKINDVAWRDVYWEFDVLFSAKTHAYTSIPSKANTSTDLANRNVLWHLHCHINEIGYSNRRMPLAYNKW
jgi:hypothetical protein